MDICLSSTGLIHLESSYFYFSGNDITFFFNVKNSNVYHIFLTHSSIKYKTPYITICILYTYNLSMEKNLWQWFTAFVLCWLEVLWVHIQKYIPGHNKPIFYNFMNYHWGKMESQCSFYLDLHLSYDYQIWIFQMFSRHLFLIFWEMSLNFISSFIDWVVLV